MDQKIKRYLQEWPANDRRAMEMAFDTTEPESLEEAVDPHSCRGRAAHLSRATRINLVSAYTYWLRHLARIGELESGCAPGARVTKQRLLSYVKGLGGVSTKSRAMYISGLYDALRVIDPVRRHSGLARLARRLHRIAKPGRDQRARLVPPSDMFDAGINRMRAVRAAADTDPRAAHRYAGGLAMAMIVCKALRLRNFAGMLIERNIVRNAMDAYEVKFLPLETKARRRIQAQLSRELTPFIDQWFERVRPVLLRGRVSDSMWITSVGTDMSSHTFYSWFCTVTTQEFGFPINPHLTRKIVATGVAIAAPEQVRMVGSLLDQTSDQSEAYNLADNLSASEQYLTILEERRRQALGAVRKTKHRRTARRGGGTRW